ncbi:MAG: TetR/AcrR family transcriptional regulator [Acidobacteriota bacterium]|jgi:AcrR family transcriptional regulator|nr:TetR/AcrR family transcriptional regulator [Acidobacteriota bacterium]
MASKSSIARERILDASSAVFAEEGFAGARVDAIAQRAGVNKAMLYYHIGDKQALYSEVLNRNFGRIEKALQEGLPNEGSPSDRLRAVITIVERAIAANPDHSRIVLREFASGAANLPAEILQRMLGLLTVVQNILADGTGNGEFRRTDPVMTHLTLIGAILMLNVVSPLRERVVDLGATVDFPTADADIARFLGDLLLEGIATPRSGEPT